MVVLKLQSQLKEQSLFVPILQSVRRPLTALTTIHQTYGELVLARFFNKKLLFVSNPEHIEEVYNQEAKGLLSRNFLYQAKKSLFGDGLVNSKSEVWAKQRRIMQPLFTKESISVWEKIITNEAVAATLKIKESAAVSEDVNLTMNIKSLVQQIFIKILMGKSIDAIGNSEVLVKAIDTISEGLLPQLVTHIISNGKLMRLMPNKKKRYHTAVDQIKTFVNQEINNKVNAPGQDLISLFIQAKDINTGYIMSQELLTDEVVNMFFAGQDTTVNTLSWFFYLIGKDISVHNKITEEITRHKDEPFTTENLAKLIYTKAALYETLRLYPPTTALATQAIEDVEISKQLISKGTTIILSMYATHRNAKLWERPNDFYPEHFINTNTTKRHKYSFFPFGGGLHNCIGRHFAELEMMIIITTMLREFTFRTNIIANEAIGITLKPNKPIIGSIRPL